MLGQHTPTHQRRRRVPNVAAVQVCLLDGLGVGMTRRSGRILDRAASAPVVVNETKLAIIAVMQELDRPVSSIELQAMWAEHKDLKLFEHHLSTLVKAKVAEVVYGPELHFRLAAESRGAGLPI